MKILFILKSDELSDFKMPFKGEAGVGFPAEFNWVVWPSFCLVFTREHLLLSATCVFKGNAVVQKNWNACRMPKIIVGQQGCMGPVKTAAWPLCSKWRYSVACSELIHNVVEFNFFKPKGSFRRLLKISNVSYVYLHQFICYPIS